MNKRRDLVCPVTLAGSLDSRIRRWLQSPRRLLEPYVRAGTTALDFGCGPGFFTLELARLVGSSGRVIAADLQPGMLERVRAKTRGTALEPRITLHQCQPDRIGLSTPVDFALAFYVLHELPDPAAFLTELRQLLTAQGQLFIVEPPFHVTRTAFEATLQVARQAGFRLVDRPRIRFNKAALLAPG
jgi:ubiquinone/menaquinone biosynthesis C-methylase UbiE